MTNLDAYKWVVDKGGTTVRTMKEATEYLNSFPGIVSPGDFSDPTVDHPEIRQSDLSYATEWDKQLLANNTKLHHLLNEFYDGGRAILGPHILTVTYDKLEIMDYLVGFYDYVIHNDILYMDAVFTPIGYGRYNDLIEGLEPNS